MSNFYPFSEEELKAAKTKREFNRVFAEVLRLRHNYVRIRDWKCITPFDLDCILSSIMLYEWHLEELDEKRYLEEVAILPPL